MLINIKENPKNEEESTAHNKVYSAWRNPNLKRFFIFSNFYQLLKIVAFFGAPRHHIQIRYLLPKLPQKSKLLSRGENHIPNAKKLLSKRMFLSLHKWQ